MPIGCNWTPALRPVSNTHTKTTSSKTLRSYFQDATGGFNHFASGLLESLARIQKRLGGERFDALRSTMLEALASHERGTPEEMHKTWIRQLLTDYYDPMYEYQMNKRTRPPVFRGNEGDVAEYLMHVAQRRPRLTAHCDEIHL